MQVKNWQSTRKKNVQNKSAGTPKVARRRKKQLKRLIQKLKNEEV